MHPVNTWAIVGNDDNVVRNIIRWNGAGNYPPPQGTRFVSVAGLRAGIGWTLNEDGTFSMPPAPSPTPEE